MMSTRKATSVFLDDFLLAHSSVMAPLETFTFFPTLHIYIYPTRTHSLTEEFTKTPVLKQKTL